MSLPSTHWSLLDAVRESPSPAHRAALQELAQRYYHPAYQHVRARGFDRQQAQDLTQGFFEHCLARELFGRADRGRGRFRTFFLTALDNYTRNAWRAQSAQRRQPEGGVESIEEDMPVPLASLEERFFRAVAIEAVKHVITAVQRYCAQRDQAVHYHVFRRCVLEPALDGAEAPSAESLATELGITPRQVANYVVTVKRIFQRQLRAYVASYAAGEADVADEIDDLMRYLRGA